MPTIHCAKTEVILDTEIMIASSDLEGMTAMVCFVFLATVSFESRMSFRKKTEFVD